MSSRPVYRMCAQVAPSGEYLRGHGRVAVDVTALRRLWQHLPMLGLVILACVPVYAVVVAVYQLLNKGNYYCYIIIMMQQGSVIGLTHGADSSVSSFSQSNDNTERTAIITCAIMSPLNLRIW